MQVLVDTSIWIDFFRKKEGSERLLQLLESGSVVTHPYIIGELRMGELPGVRNQVIDDLKNLPSLKNPPESVISDFIENLKLFSTGLSYIDAVLLCSAKSSGIKFLTSDKLLMKYMR